MRSSSGGPQPVTITGNYIGTDGAAALGNKFAGISVANRTGVQIGGTTAADRNVVAANTDGIAPPCCSNGFGINVISGADGTVIQGNYIGTDATGTADLGNKTYGIALGTANNLVGGAIAGARNVISGNDWGGIIVTGASTGHDNQILGNYVGLNATGTAALSNTNHGVLLNGAGANNAIGVSGAGNVIAAAAELVYVSGGCGTGDLAIELARRVGPDGAVVGCDFSEPMLDLARRKASERRLSQVRFEWADALELPYDDGSFDAVTVGFGVRNLAVLERGLAELARVLKPGGRLVILEITQPRRPPLSTFYSLWFDRVVPLLGTLAGDRGAYTYLPESVKRFPRRSAWRR